MSAPRPLADASHQADAAPLRSTRSAGFVGRGHELADLIGSLHAMPDPAGPIRLITGAPGIGKSRLAAELSRRAAADGTDVVWGRCWNEAGTPPYWPWTQVVRELLVLSRGTDLADLVLDDPTRAERFDLFDAVAEVVQDRARRSRLLIVLDDLHEADEPSLLLTRFVARQLRDLPLMIVATVRTAALDEPGRHQHLEGLVRLGREVPLDGLTIAEVEQLVGDRGAATQVHAITGGNPLFVEQMVHSSDRGDRLTLVTTSSPSPRDGLRRAVLARIDTLDPATQRLVEAAAVLGLRHSESELAALVGRDQAPDGVVAPAITAGVLRRCDAGEIEFTHPLVAEVVESRLAPADAEDLHRRVAGLLATDADRAEEQAHHLLRAGPAARAAAIAACLRAADQADRSLAHEDAAGHLERALEVMPDRPSLARERVELLLRLGGTLWRSTEVAAAEEVYERAWELAVGLGDPQLITRSALRSGLSYHFSRPAPSPWPGRVGQALAAQPDGDSVERAQLLAQQATLRLGPTELPAARALAQQSLAMARRLDDPVALGCALLATHVSDLGPATMRSRIANAHEILACAGEADDDRLRLHGRFLLMGALLEAGDLRGLQAEYHLQHSHVEELGEARFARFASWFRCTRALLDGLPARAEALAEQAYAISQHIGDPDGLGVYGGQVGVARWMQGRIMEMEPVFTAMRDDEPDELLWPAALAWIWADNGRLDAATGALAAIDDLTLVPQGMHWLMTITAWGDAAASVGTEDQAAAAWSALLPYSERMVPIAMGAATWGTVAKPLGRLALRLGRVDDGLEHLATAVQMCARLAARPWLIDAQLELVRALAEHRPADPRIPALLTEATATAEQLELDHFVSRATELRAALPAPGAAVPSVVVGPSGPTEAPRPRVNVLGTFGVVSLDGVDARWTSRKARELLKILVARRGVPIAREAVMDFLWPGEDPGLLGNRLSVALSTVRRSLDPTRQIDPNDLVTTSIDAVRLGLDVVEVDLEVFLATAERAMDASRRGHYRALEMARTALDLHRGEALPDEPHADWAAPVRNEVRAAFVSVARLVAAEDLRRGDHLRAADVFRRILDEDLYDEEAHLGLTRAFRAMGAHGQADAAYDTYRARMVDLGVPAAPDPTRR